MVLIDRDARIIHDPWTYAVAEEALPIGPNAVVPIGTLAAAGADALVERPMGASVLPHTPVEALGPFLTRLDLIVVEFPKFRDGRGFTIGRTLRGRYGYKGDIRAIGHVLPDQFGALVECGFSSIVTPPEHPPEQWSGRVGSEQSLQHRPVQLLNRLISRGVATS